MEKAIFVMEVQQIKKKTPALFPILVKEAAATGEPSHFKVRHLRALLRDCSNHANGQYTPGVGSRPPRSHRPPDTCYLPR